MADPVPTPTPATDPKPDPKPDPTPDPTPDPARTFSQADVDRIVQDRVARVKAEPPKDYADLQAAAKKLAEIEEANKTELERATARADKAEADAKAATERAKETSLRSAIVAEAAKRQVVDPDAAVALIDRALLEVDDNGVPTNVAKAMDSLLKDKPYLAGGARGTTADQGARTGGADQLTKAALEKMSPEEITKATSDGRFNTLLGA